MTERTSPRAMNPELSPRERGAAGRESPACFDVLLPDPSAAARQPLFGGRFVAMI
jgi:hypothetical protein